MLVNYSDSDSDVEAKQETSKKRKFSTAPAREPPPLPPSFHSLYTTNVRAATADDPALHGGRSRQVPHTEGNWPTHVYLEWRPSKDQCCIIQDQVTKLNARTPASTDIHSFLKSGLDVQQPLHISLSAPLVLKTEQKDGFREAVAAAIAASEARPFSVTPTHLAWVPNLDDSRQFLVLKLTKPENDEMNKLLAACNSCAKNLSMALLYNNSTDARGVENSLKSSQTRHDRSSAFHISIAWTLEIPSAEDQMAVTQLVPTGLLDMDISFSVVKIKIGNVVTDVPLESP